MFGNNDSRHFLPHIDIEENRTRRLEHLGGLVESAVAGGIERAGLEAPVLSPEEDGSLQPQAGVWYRYPVPEGISGDGSEYHIYIKKGKTDRLVLFFSGGGVAWNEYTAARPVTGGRVAAGEPNYYWSNLRPFTQVMNIHIGITENGSRNPFSDWSFVVITYATGDLHVGDSRCSYCVSEDGEDEKGVKEGEDRDLKSVRTLYFHGRKNARASLKIAASLFPSPEKLLVAGDSAGGFAVPAYAGEIMDEWFPRCPDVTLFSDSSLVPCSDWQRIARDVWKAPDALWQAADGPDLTLDWYRMFMENLRGQTPGSSREGRNNRKGAAGAKTLRCLYASSTHDYLLSTYYNDITNKIYGTDAKIQEAFYHELQEMVHSLRILWKDIPHAFFINDWKNLRRPGGGTAHTAVREPQYYLPVKDGATMAKWLYDAVNGRVYDVGIRLLQDGDQ